MFWSFREPPKLNVIFLSIYILVQDYICILPNTFSNWQLHFYYFPIFAPLSLIFNRTKVLVSISLIKNFKRESKKLLQINKKAADQFTFWRFLLISHWLLLHGVLRPLKELHFKLPVRTAILIMCGKVVDERLPLASGIHYGEASRPHRVFGNFQKSTYYAAYSLTPPTHILQINLIWSFIEFIFLITNWYCTRLNLSECFYPNWIWTNIPRLYQKCYS